MENDPVEIVDLPIENGGSFHRYVNVYQRVPFNHWEILIYWKSISQHPLSHFCLLSYIFRRLFNDWIATWLPELTYFGNPKEHLIFAKSLVFSQTVLWSTMVHWLVFFCHQATIYCPAEDVQNLSVAFSNAARLDAGVWGWQVDRLPYT